MSQPLSLRSWLPILPALTVLVVIAVFGLNALSLSGNANVSHHKQPNAQTQLSQLGQVANFKLTERSGNTVSLSDLKGYIWVADFIFTSCQSECPLMNLEMQKIESQFLTHERVKLVSFSVDPETDTPATLREYAKKWTKNEEKWLFMTGNRSELHDLAIKSFKLGVQAIETDHADSHSQHHNQAKVPSSTPFLHSQKFVLIDAQGQIRSYYDSTDPAAIRRLLERDLPQLLAEG